MMAPVRCFFLTETDQAEMSLRRYEGSRCPGPWGYHNAEVVIGRAGVEVAGEVGGDSFPHDDTRWPKACGCGYQFKPADHWQYNPNTLFRRSDTGDLVTLRNAPVGAMWFAPWYSDLPEYRGPDGNTLVVRLPGNHDWVVDSRANNCTLPADKVHKCWVRHGTPPMVTVDKDGVTCSAGAGSIAIPGWHGFLRNGILAE